MANVSVVAGAKCKVSILFGTCTQKFTFLKKNHTYTKIHLPNNIYNIQFTYKMHIIISMIKYVL
jgi:hypothetical protein